MLNKFFLDCKKKKRKGLVSEPDFNIRRPGVIIFSLIRYLPDKKQPNQFFLKKNRNRTETESNQPVSIRFGSWFQKTEKTYTLIFLLELTSSLFTNIVFPALCKL